MLNGAATCASDQVYAPPAQSKASSINVALRMNVTDPMGSIAHIMSLTDILDSVLGGQ